MCVGMKDQAFSDKKTTSGYLKNKQNEGIKITQNELSSIKRELTQCENDRFKFLKSNTTSDQYGKLFEKRRNLEARIAILKEKLKDAANLKQSGNYGHNG
jgi:hypothetical protein